MSRHILVVASESPWPPNHGGRVDMWYRYKALKALGWTIDLVAWYTVGEADPTDQDRNNLSQVFSKVYLFPKPNGIRGAIERLSRLPFMSTHVSGRLLTRATLNCIAADLSPDKPGIVISDSIYGYPAAKGLAKRVGVPLALRSHNIEHLYMRQQSELATHFKKRVQLAMACANLEAFETKAHKDCDWVFDISHADLEVWRNRGFAHNSVLPTLIDMSPTPEQDKQTRDFDFVYLGNLNTPNNVQGLRWLFKEVLPLVEANPSLLIAGSRPNDEVRDLVKTYPNASLMADVPDAGAIRRRGKVLINPILSGSGINVKSLEMLKEGVPVVTTPIGVQGLSGELKKAFLIAATPQDFSARMKTALDGWQSSGQQSRALCERYMAQALEDFQVTLKRLIGSQ